MKPINLDNVVIGSGLSALSFSNEFLKKNKKIDIICPVKNLWNREKSDEITKIKQNLPPQIYNKKSLNSVLFL
jgi:hypothetical protein